MRLEDAGCRFKAIALGCGVTSQRRFSLFSALPLLFALVFGTSAQTFRGAAVQTVLGTPTLMATGDFNRDGKADVVYQDAITGGSLHVMFGNGDGTFHEVQQIPLPLNVGGRITVADLNNDGFPDLIVSYVGANPSGAIPAFTALLNRGDGTFGAPIYSPFPFKTADYDNHHIAVADFNADGKMDFIFAGSAGLVLMRGDGMGNFIPLVIAPPLSYGDLQDVYLADFNEDGKGDVAINGSFGVYYALNLGGGVFGPVTTIAQVLTNPPLGFGTADIDGDGHQDIVYGYNSSIYAAFGKGDGTFAPPRTVGSAATAPGYAYLGFTDVNGDGRLDLVTSYSGGPVTQLQTAAGQFAFTYGVSPAVGDRGFLAPVYADFDGDGIGDVVTGASGALVFSKGRADGTFHGAQTTVTGGNVLDIQAADFNNDGLVDVAITQGGGSYYGVLQAYLGDGTGTFSQRGSIPYAYPVYAGQSSVADFNGDGIPDLFNAGYALHGDGKGGFPTSTRIASPPSGNRPEGFTVVADFNEDGSPDGVTTTASSGGGTACTLAVGLSAGAGQWNTKQITLPYTNTINGGTPVCAGPLVAADFNRDGHMDLATASFGSIYTYLGDGKGNFTAGQIIPIGYTATGYYAIQSGQNDMEAADLDGDGNVDLIVPIADMNVIQIFYGRGDGTFEPAVSLPTAQDVRYVTVADMNHDGIPDMILGGHALVRILHGLGHRQFETTPTSYAANPYPQKIRVADVNHDGNPDLLVPNGGYSAVVEPGNGFTVLLNTAQASSPDLLYSGLICSPEPSPVGQAFTCTATFTPAANSASPVGTISFSADGVAAGTAVLTSQKAVLTFPATLSAGSHAITASFPGDRNFKAATASITHVVSLATASILLSGPAHVAFGQPVVLQAMLTGSGAGPTGMVSFKDGASTLGQTQITAGSAGLTTSTLSPGIHTLQAAYGGDAAYTPGLSNTLTVVVDAQLTSTVLQASPVSGPLGATIALTATVSAPVGPLSGTVKFFDGSTLLGAAAIDTSGSAHFATTTLALGTHTLSAQFVGTTSLAASVSVGVQVNITGIQTSTTLTAGPNPAYPGQAVSLSATVRSSASAPALTGTVRFFDGSVVLGDAPLNAASIATLSTSTFAVGTHPLQASYLGTTPFIGSQSNLIAEVVLNSSFTLEVMPPQITLQTQHHTTFNLKVTPVGAFSGAVLLDCGVLPAHATCRITPQAVVLTAGGNAQVASVYLDTSDVFGYASAGAAPLSRRIHETWAAILLLPMFAGFGMAARRKRIRSAGGWLFLAAAFLVLTFGATGCSGKLPASVEPGDYTLYFTGLSNTPPLSQTAPLHLTVTE